MSSSFPPEGKLQHMVSSSLQEMENDKILLTSMQHRLKDILSNDKTGPYLRSPDRTISGHGPVVFTPDYLVQAYKHSKLEKLGFGYVRSIIAEQEVKY